MNTQTTSIDSYSSREQVKVGKKINIKTKRKINLIILILISIALIYTYLFINVDMKYFDFAMYLRKPKLMCMILAAFCIGTASIAFQSVINNHIVTPCLLGMNGLYVLTATVVAFSVGTHSPYFLNKNLAFVTNVTIMSVVAVVLYGYMFKKANYNILYVLLSGTVLASLFGSITGTLSRVMDPNDYANLQDKIIAGFNNVNGEIITAAIILIVVVGLFFYKDIKLLDDTTRELLLEYMPKKIIYSSCKASTMARDIGILSEKYELKELCLVDMFPQTHHVELLSLLELKN